MSTEAPALELQGVDVPFGEGPGLVGIDLTVQAGERFVLVGASGAGKSSLLRAIAGSGPITAGTIRIGGEATAGRSARDRDLVLLEQRPLLFPHLSVRANVAFPLEVRGVGREEIERRVEEALEAVRLPELAGRMPRTLSGGQAHRVALARAVVARPRVLLLDEPLTSLDVSLREEMRDAIGTVGERYDTTLLMVTHDLREAGRIGSRLGVLTDGRLAQVDTPARLFRAPASLAVARFIGWRNELPGHIESDGSVYVQGRMVIPAVPEAGDGMPPTGPALVTFGADGGLLRSGKSEGLPVRVTGVRHDPQGATAEFVLTTSAGRPDGRGGGVGDAPATGEVAVAGDESLAVGAVAHLQVLPYRAQIFPLPDSSCTGGTP